MQASAGVLFKHIQLSNDVALAAVRKDAVVWSKLVFASTLLAVVASCDWGSSDWGENWTKGQKRTARLYGLTCFLLVSGVKAVHKLSSHAYLYYLY